MWSNMYSPDKPQVRKRVDWRRMGALFAPYWRQQSLVLACIVISAVVGLAPAYFIAHIIDKAIPHGSFREVAADVGHARGGTRDDGAYGRPRLPKLNRRRRHHARHAREPGFASAPDAAQVLHRDEEIG